MATTSRGLATGREEALPWQRLRPRRPVGRLAASRRHLSLTLASSFFLILLPLIYSIYGPSLHVTASSSPSQSRPAPLSRRSFTHIPSDTFHLISSLSDAVPILDHTDSSSWLARFLFPRVPGDPGIIKARKMITDVFEKQLGPSDGKKGRGMRTGWKVEEHASQGDTPHGVKPFVNVVATKDPEAPRKLVLAAHYDSKWFERGSFVGATDSAAPCAMLIDLAISLDALLEGAKKKRKEGKGTGDGLENVTLQLIFFDGEEAWDRWTHTDSIYGSRALVANWTKSYDESSLPSSSHQARRLTTHGRPVRRIDSIDHFILLDLLGAKHPTIPSYYASTHWLFRELLSAERRLRDSGHLYPDIKSSNEAQSFFVDRDPMLGAGIEDDHLPFIANGVPVLHLIPTPFPRVWHTLKDDASALDWPTNYAWSMILRLFTAEYLGLEMPQLIRKDEDEEGWADDGWLRIDKARRGERVELASSGP